MDWFKPELKTKKEKDPIKEIVAKYIKEKDRLAERNSPKYSKMKSQIGRVRVRKSQDNFRGLFVKAINKIDEAMLRGHSKDKALGYIQGSLSFNENKMRILVEMMNQNIDFFQSKGIWS